MKRLLLLSVIASMQFTGCVTPTAPLQPAITGHITLADKPIVSDPPEVLFDAIFADLSKYQKDPYETIAHYEERMRLLNASDETYVFLIPPEHCEYGPFPEQNIYAVVSKDPYRKPLSDYRSKNPERREYSRYDPPFGITISETKKGVSYTGYTIFGNPVVNTVYKILKLSIPDFRRYPHELRFLPQEKTSHPHFGLFMQSDFPAFIEKLKSKKIGLAVRVKLADLRDAVMFSDISGSNRFGYSTFETYYLPVDIIDVWLIDIDTHYSIMRWIRDYL
jgi:hypothetical protein